MATPYQIESSGDWWMQHAIVHQYGTALYVRLYHRYDDQIGIFKSTDNGVTWAQVSTSVQLQLGFTFVPGCGTVNGSVLYITYNEYDFGATPDTSYIGVLRFDMSTDSWLLPWTGTQLLDDGDPTSVAYSQWNQIGFRSDGSAVVQYIHNESDGLDFRRKWKYVTVSSIGVFGSAAELSTAWQTWVNTSQDRLFGVVPIASDDSAHFFYFRSESGTSNMDTQLMHRRLDADGTLGAEAVAVDFDGTVTNPRGALIATISGTESVLTALTNGDGNGPNPENAAVIYGPVVDDNPAWTYTVNTTQAVETTQQWMANANGSVYGTWPVSEVSGEYTGVKIGRFSGSWGGETTVNAGDATPTPEPTWNWWTMNALGTSALGLVLEHYDDQTPWFIRFPLSFSFAI